MMTEVAGQDMLEVTMTMLDSYCPSIRKDLELTLHPQEKKEKKVEGKEEVQAVNVEKNEEEEEEQLQLQQQQQGEENSTSEEKREEEEEEGDVVVVDGDQEENDSNDNSKIPENLSGEKQEDELVNEEKEGDLK